MFLSQDLRVEAAAKDQQLGMLLQAFDLSGDYCSEHQQIRDLADKQGGNKM